LLLAIKYEYYLKDEINEDEMDGTDVTHWEMAEFSKKM
jgi:hypothetical protein